MKKIISNIKEKIKVMNDAVRDKQEIKTAYIIVPVLGVGKMDYKPYETSPDQDKAVTVDYTEAAVSDPEYIKSLLTSPMNVGTHDQNTGENDKFVDGWVVDSWFDKDKKQAMVKGVIIGQKEVAYVTDHKNSEGFGASGFITFDDYTKDDTGNIVLKKITNQHIAITENIRDPSLKISSMNSQDVAMREAKTKVDLKITPVKDEDKRNEDNIKNVEGSTMTPEEIKEEIKNAVNSAMNDATNAAAANAEMDGVKKDIEEIKNALNAMNEEKKDDGEESAPVKVDAENMDEDDKDKDDESKDSASNALVSDVLLAKVAEKTGLVFNSETSLKDLKDVFELEEKKPLDILKAVNAILDESKDSATNAEDKKVKFSGNITELM